MCSKHFKLPHAFLNHMFLNKASGIKASHTFTFQATSEQNEILHHLLQTVKHINFFFACFTHI